MEDIILEVKKLNKSFKDFSLKDVSFTLKRGYIMGFIGPNGAGKTTTIKLIMNLMKRESGEIRIFGLDNIKHEKEIKTRIGFVYDRNYFYEELTVAEMKNFVARTYRNWNEGAFKKYIRMFGIPENKKIKSLSRGMNLKFSLAIALSHHAELLIMDEPTSGLDPMARSELRDILLEIIQDDKKSVFFSTHITSDLDKIADYVTFIHNGKIILSESKEEILDRYAIVKGERSILTPEVRNKFVGIKEYEFGFEGLVYNRKEIAELLGNRVVIENPDLEDIMIYHTRGNQNDKSYH